MLQQPKAIFGAILRSKPKPLKQLLRNLSRSKRIFAATFSGLKSNMKVLSAATKAIFEQSTDGGTEVHDLGEPAHLLGNRSPASGGAASTDRPDAARY